MTISIIFFITIIFIAIFLVPIFKKNIGENNKEEYLPYIKKEYLMTKAESEFFKVLQRAVQDKYYIVPQVQLSDIIQVEKYEKQKRKYRNKIDRKSVDFVLFNKEYFTPHLVIELDDSSHSKEDRKERDIFVDRALDKAGINIIHIKTAYNYDLVEVSNMIY